MWTLGLWIRAILVGTWKTAVLSKSNGDYGCPAQEVSDGVRYGVVHAINPSTQKAVAGGSPSSIPDWS